jgi:hypothetical protein
MDLPSLLAEHDGLTNSGGVVVMDLSTFWPTDNSNRFLRGLFSKVLGRGEAHLSWLSLSL